MRNYGYAHYSQDFLNEEPKWKEQKRSKYETAVDDSDESSDDEEIRERLNELRSVPENRVPPEKEPRESYSPPVERHSPRIEHSEHHTPRSESHSSKSESSPALSPRQQLLKSGESSHSSSPQTESFGTPNSDTSTPTGSGSPFISPQHIEKIDDSELEFEPLDRALEDPTPRRSSRTTQKPARFRDDNFVYGSPS